MSAIHLPQIDTARSVTDGGDGHGLDAICFSSAADKLYLVQSKSIKKVKAIEPFIQPPEQDLFEFSS